MSVKVLFAFGVSHRIQQAALTAAKNYHAKKRLFVYSANEKRLAMFSRYLWDVAPEAFIPNESIHSLEALQDCLRSVDALDPAPQPVLLIHDSELLTSDLLNEVAPSSWLLNLDLQCPPDYQRFACVLEVVSEHEEDKQYARERWKQYRADKVELIAHQMTRA